MLQTFFDRRLVRIALGVAVGLPISALAFVGALYGLALGFGGLWAGSNLMRSGFLTAVTLLGLAGISGAWRRVLRPSADMTGSEARTVQMLLGAGVLASLGLAIGAVLWLKSFWLGAAFTVLGCGGVLLVLATPNNSRSLSSNGIGK